jgi:propanol-preferring alcohol dehydrogenase
MHYRVEKKEKLGEIFKEMEEGKLKGRVVLDLS